MHTAAAGSTSQDGQPVQLTVPGFSIQLGEHAPASVLERHTHEDPTICAVQRGSFTEYYPGRAVACDARTVKVTPAGEPHWNRFDAAPTRGLRIDVDAPRFESEPPVARLLNERLFFPAAPFTPVVETLVAELSRPDAYSAISVEGLLLELLATMGRVGASQAPTARLSWLTRAEEMIRSSYRSQLTVAAVADEVGVPASRLARSYRRAYGCTIGERIRSLRLEYAARQLVETDAALSDVALRSGFYDQSHFSNAFRRHFGITPGSYRQWSCGATAARSRPRV